jgi:hypothetical protein
MDLITMKIRVWYRSKRSRKIRIANHAGIDKTDEKEYRLTLLKDYLSCGYRVVKMEREE